jgi:hypothetical protein
MFLRPHNKDYWSASNNAPHVAKVNEGLLAHGYLDVSAIGAGSGPNRSIRRSPIP